MAATVVNSQRAIRMSAFVSRAILRLRELVVRALVRLLELLAANWQIAAISTS